jgi:protein tyrosine/serine phosphatase
MFYIDFERGKKRFNSGRKINLHLSLGNLSFKRFIFLFIICMLLNGCAYSSYITEPFSNIPNFHQVNSQIYRGGRPSEDGLRQLKEMGIKTIISLRSDDSLTYVEKHLARQYGLEFISIPLSIYQKPTDEQVLKFLEIVIDKEKQPIFIHCESGRDRTGVMIAVYRVVVEGRSIKESYKEAKSYGFWPYRGRAELKKFIHQLKDKPQYFEAVGRKPPTP